MFMQTKNEDVIYKKYEKFKSLFDLYTKPGVLAFYNHFQAIEIIAFPPKGYDKKIPINIFTILVCSEGEGSEKTNKIEFVNKDKRIVINGAKGWSFGVVKYQKNITEINEVLSNYISSKLWSPAGTDILVGDLKPLNEQYVPSDSALDVTLNKLLKNNFYNGSYILELCDIEKENISFLLEDSKILQELSQIISQYIPISIASVSERIGNVIFQFPISILMAKCLSDKNDELTVNIAWHPDAKKRKLIATLESVYDEVVQKYVSVDVSEGCNYITNNDFSGGFRWKVWDKYNQLLLYASTECSFIKMMNFQMNISDPEPRQFTLDEEVINLKIHGRDSPSQIGTEAVSDLHKKLVNKRLFRDEIVNISLKKEFLQYGKGGCKHSEHRRAISDLRTLINLYGNGGVWLWDPYLSANDVLKTLFFNTYAGADLKALSGGLSPFNESIDSNGWAEEQKSVMNKNCGNKRRLKLEYRFRNGSDGWAFHDRFIIFPREVGETALAWSLGTSVNSMGYQHHTLQKVLDGELIKHSFEELWSELKEEKHLLWKS
ncbi:hypothetical protein VP758_000301 [Vibrio harveyi]|uniref:VPA1262 family N-terminal domain-containing protein n=1 Tax=Vibrio harveyi TaxID=669 RepID=UPI002B9D6B44|nr:hypothetical protein [Vibrio harveyi]